MDGIPPQKKTPSARKKEFTPFHQFLAVALALLIIGGVYFAARGEAGTTVNTTFTGGTPGGEVDLESGLVGHWTFDGEDVDLSLSSLQIRDRSGSGNHATINNSYKMKRLTSGVLGQAYYLEGIVDHCVNIPHNDSLSILNNNKTWALWFRTGGSTRSGLFRKSGGVNLNGILCDINGADVGRVRCYVNDNSLSSKTVSSPLGQSYNNNTWHHMTATLDQSAQLFKLFINGVEVSSTSTATLSFLAESSQGFLGVTNSIAGPLLGSLDDVRIYNRALSAAEVKRLYELGATTRVSETITTNPTLEDGLVGHWTFDGPDIDWASTTAEIRDRSGNGNHGDARDVKKIDIAPGVVGQALRFNDLVGSRAIITNPETFAYTGVGSLTISAWVHHEETGSGYVVSKPWSGSGVYNYWLSVNHEGLVLLRLNYGCTQNASLGSNARLRANEWTHVLITINSDKIMTLFIDGELDNTTSHSISDWTAGCTHSVHSLTFGAIFDYGTWNQTPAQGYNGTLDDVRIYDRALSAEEVKRLYQLGATTRVSETITTNPTLEDGLVGHWTFDGPDVDWGAASGQARDRSGQGNHGTLAAGTVLMSAAKSPAPGVLGQALHFDPTGWEPASKQGQFIVVPHDASLGVQELTTAAWVRIKSNTYIMRVIDKSNGTGAFGYTFRIDFGYPGLAVGNGTSGLFRRFSPRVELGTWTHIAATYSSDGILQVYVNGVPGTVNYEQGSALTGTLGTYVGDLLIGERLYANFGPFYGDLDDVRVYNRALSAEEVKRLYDMGQ